MDYKAEPQLGVCEESIKNWLYISRPELFSYFGVNNCPPPVDHEESQASAGQQFVLTTHGNQISQLQKRFLALVPLQFEGFILACEVANNLLGEDLANSQLSR